MTLAGVALAHHVGRDYTDNIYTTRNVVLFELITVVNVDDNCASCASVTMSTLHLNLRNSYHQQAVSLVSEPATEAPRRVKRQRLLSASLSVAEIEAVMKPETTLPTYKLVLRRLLAVAVMVAILAAGIAVRLLVELPDNAVSDEALTTADYANSNSTFYVTTPRSDDMTVGFL